MNPHHHRSTLFPVCKSYAFITRLVFLILGTALILSAIPVQAQSEAGRQTYAIPAGTLKSVLVSFGQANGVMISYTESEIAGKRSSGIHGSFTVLEALNVLLTGTGLEASKRVEGGFTLRPQTPVITGQTLPLMTVSTSADNLKQGTAEEGYRVSNISGAGPWGERSLQDTPYSMSIIPSDLIENAFITDMDQIARVNPIIQLNRSSGHDDNQFPVIRGFSNFALIMDGMRLSAAPQGISLEEVERVEVLSGT
ncbi:MAG: TonB-dependent receptor, partial [Nitrosomonas sp. PRO5]|nr:TonB-dependent receptor [Nitrosomonas sp. PRO5]